MSQPLPSIYLVRHGETAWTLSRQHTGLTDLPLTGVGEQDARKLGVRLRPLSVPHIFTSPLQRARRTCELAGFGRQGRSRSRLGRMELWELRRLDERRDQEAKTRLEPFPRRLPGRGVGGTDRRQGRSVHCSTARARFRRDRLLQRPYHARARRTLARFGRLVRPIVHARHHDAEHSQLRAR